MPLSLDRGKAPGMPDGRDLRAVGLHSSPHAAAGGGVIAQGTSPNRTPCVMEARIGSGLPAGHWRAP